MFDCSDKKKERIRSKKNKPGGEKMNIEKSLEVLRGMKFMQRKEEAQRRERLQQQAANPPASATAHNAAASIGGPSSSSAAAPRARILFSSSSSSAGAAPQQGRLAFGVKRTTAVAPAVSVQHEDSGEAMGDGSSSTVMMEGVRPFQGGAPSSDQQDPSSSSSGGRFLLQTTVRAPKLPQALIRSEQDRRKRKRNEQEEQEFERWEGQRRR